VGSVDVDGLVARAEAILEQAWRPPGFCVPNAATYPHQWLWDSCFHSVAWTALGRGSDRGRVELANALAHQEETGLVPHLTYWSDRRHHEELWGRPMTSTITQPPLYGHALRQLERGGVEVSGELIEAVGRGLRYLLVERPRTNAGLIPIVHPWESGCDDSARWDSFRNPDRSWYDTKADLVAALGASSPFAVGSIGFNALVGWNTFELLAVDGAAPFDDLGPLATELVATIATRWDETASTWADDGPPSGRTRTLDALLATLVDPRAEAFGALVDPGAHGASFGPRGVHAGEPSYEPDVYWRGPAWPQLGYLLWRAAAAAGQDEVARELGRALVAGAIESGFAEYWHPETGRGLGAIPQTWTTLAAVVAIELGW
jgi:hypothetical protein